MATSDCLSSSLQKTHSDLAERLDAARTHTEDDRADSRAQRGRIDTFLASTSQHLHAVDAVLLPIVRRVCEDGRQRVHDYLVSAKALEVELSHVKAHEYGSVYEHRFAWQDVWVRLEAVMADAWKHEQELGAQLAEALDGDRLQALCERLAAAELTAPTRPHPYTPHTGILGLMARKVMHAVDSFWDAAEGRMVPEPERSPRKEPGLFGQYLLGDPRFDPEQERERTPSG